MSKSLKVFDLKPYFKLKQQECILEKSIETLMVNSKTNLEFWNSIKREADQLDNERQKLEDSLKESVRRIYEELKSIKEMINPENVKAIDLDLFKKKLQALWKKIQDLKASCKPAEDLTAEQAIVEADLNVLMRAIRKHKDLSNVHDSVYRVGSCKKAQTQNENSNNHDDDECEEDFSSLVAKTGHTGSWSEEDHFLYVKLRKKHKNITSLIQALQSKCPDLSNESIVNHDAWYRTYLDLREKQRRAVKEWRQQKEEAERAKMLAQKPKLIRAESAPEVTNNLPTENEKTCSSMELNRMEMVKVEDKKVSFESKREMVRVWRDQKEKVRMEEEERMRDRMKAREEEKGNKWKARDAKLKRILAESKEKKLIDEEKEPCGDNVQSVPSNFHLQAYRAKDQEFIERRKNILLSKSNVPKQCIPAIQYNFSKINESTLFNETKAWQERQRATEPKVLYTSNYIKDLPKRAIVSWKSYEIPDSTLYRQRY